MYAEKWGDMAGTLLLVLDVQCELFGVHQWQCKA
jgi:hypothetical protein